MKIGIIDYGLGNLRSVYGAFKECESIPIVSDNPKELKHVEKLVLPGVGAFGDGMQRIKVSGLFDCIEEQVLVHKKPILGICLGFQLFFEKSMEFGEQSGFGWIKGKLESLNQYSVRVPHVGWNNCYQTSESVLWSGVDMESLFYYVHSYHVKADEEQIMIGKCKYGVYFISAFQKDNLYGVQFHPEKSQLAGLKVIKNFINLT